MSSKSPIYLGYSNGQLIALNDYNSGVILGRFTMNAKEVAQSLVHYLHAPMNVEYIKPEIRFKLHYDNDKVIMKSLKSYLILIRRYFEDPRYGNKQRKR